MRTADLLADGFGRIREAVYAVLDDIAPEHLTGRIDPEANSVAWLIWHLTRIQDDHVAAAAGGEQEWMTGWAGQFALSLPRADTGYGHTADQAALVTVDADLLRQYYDAVHGATVRFVGGITDADLDRVVDERWDPPVTLGVRLVSVIADDLEHVGQAAYARGVLERR